MVNQVILIGRVGADPIVRHTPAGLAVTEVSLATDKGFGEGKKTFWHKVTFWRESAEKIGTAVKKGDTLYAEGSLEYQEYEKNGQKVQKAVIQGHSWRHLISKGPVTQRGLVTEDDVL
jgi:single-strand DNA-binding protein